MKTGELPQAVYTHAFAANEFKLTHHQAKRRCFGCGHQSEQDAAYFRALAAGEGQKAVRLHAQAGQAVPWNPERKQPSCECVQTQSDGDMTSQDLKLYSGVLGEWVDALAR